jgi:hypothetical protein
MYESKSFIYLDLQKTGTNFIVDFLKRFNSEGKGRRRKHRPVTSDSGKLRFISVRDPLDQYVSLYSFGCDEKGALFHRMEKRGQRGLYKGASASFPRWLAFVLDPLNAKTVNRSYASTGSGRISELIGFQSFRFLSLALPDAERVFGSWETREDIIEAYRALNPPLVLVRHSNFVNDLKNLVRNELRGAIADPEAALRFLDEAPVLNASDRIDKGKKLDIDQPLRELLRQREWLYYDGLVET